MVVEGDIVDISGDGGVKKEILVAGTGTETPCYGCKVSVQYTGKLTDGTIFDSSVDRGQPLEFTLGTGDVIKAFDMGVLTMKLGEKCNLTCAPEYAYGEVGSPPSIPPNSTLIFELEMLGWMGEDVSPMNDGGIERIIVEKGTKKRTPKDGAFVEAHITGKYEGKVFESRDVEFDFGEGSDIGIIEGVENCIRKMTVGEISRFKIKPTYAFGSKGNEEFGIPPNATVEYTIKLNNCAKVTDDWKYSKEEHVEQARIYKDKGTKYFKKGNYPLAIKMYKKCCSSLNTENDDVESNKLRVAAYSNQALCHQKTNEYFEGKIACDEALKLEPTNIKALYRRGQCNLVTNEFKTALNDFQKVLELEPSNKAAQNQIQICKQKIKETNDKEKKMYANMFMKLAAADKEDIPSETDVLAKCGEWTDEDTKREVDRAFERDNNIVMI